MNTRETTCVTCKRPLTVPRIRFGRLELLATIGVLCDACSAPPPPPSPPPKPTGIPPRLAAAEAEKVPDAYAEALLWSREAHDGGLGLVGPSGAGKSCAVAIAASKSGLWLQWTTGDRLRETTHGAATGHEDAACRLRAITRTSLLVVDDISQPVFTPSFAAALLKLLDHRHGSLLPTLWTAQIPPRSLRDKIAAQCGDDAQAAAIVRRLTQNSLVLVKQ